MGPIPGSVCNKQSSDFVHWGIEQMVMFNWQKQQ